MSQKPWMIYGAYGYSGVLITREAVRRGLRPLLAGRNEDKLAVMVDNFDLDYQCFDLDDPHRVAERLHDMELVLHCAGPFSKTCRPMLEACLESRTHYLDITGEIDVFVLAHARDERAKKAGVVLCPGVGFDVIPTDCVAATLGKAMPEATHLALGFDSRSSFSPGTAKTSVEGLGHGGRIRRDGLIETVPLAWKVRQIDFGDGEKTATTIPWGDVATAFFTTRIPHIEVYIPSSPKMITKMKRLNWVRPLLRMGLIQSMLKKRIEKSVRGPSEKRRKQTDTHVWGEVTDAAGNKKTARLKTANGYEVTVTGSLAVVQALLEREFEPGYTTPSRLMGEGLASTLPGAGEIIIT